jgi:hypothetical protein
VTTGEQVAKGGRLQWFLTVAPFATVKRKRVTGLTVAVVFANYQYSRYFKEEEDPRWH